MPGLFYENYAEFAETLYAITSGPGCATRSGATAGRTSARTTRGRSSSGSTSRRSTGWRGEPREAAGARTAAWLLRPPTPHASTRRRRARRDPGRSGAAMSLRAVHQVLATLGYGDAIGHEVLGIQRVLRAAGYDSEIFVETADTRLEDLTYDYRDLVDASHPDNLLIHHFSIGSRASRVAYALPDRMALVYHNITPPEYFVGVHKQLVRAVLEGTPRAEGVRRPLRSRARRLGVQPAGTGGARLPGDRRPAGGPGLLAPRRHPRLARRRPVRRRAGRTSCLWVG